jgi:RND superfamily putative drug exporter
VSSFLYGLGRAAFRRRLLVLLAWVAALAVVGGLALAVSDKFDESFTLPGTESQVALDALNRTFPQASGTTADLIVVPREGQSVRSAAAQDAIRASVGRLADIPQVDAATSPFDRYAKGLVAGDDSAAIISVRFDTANTGISPATFDALAAETSRLQSSLPGSDASIGGQAYSGDTPGLSLTELVGVLVALVVLFFTLGSLRAAGMPLITAVLGVALTMMLIFGATGIATISSTTPLLALMLGLAVGIDYALFITSRHRDQLRDGMAPEESVAQAVATSGSAVVFAGMTVMIALCGLAVAGIPFLTTMGVAAAIGVAIAVLIALTLLPSMLGFAGDRLRPKARRTRPGSSRAPARLAAAAPKVGLGRRWVRLVTKVPVLTVVLVVAGLGVMSYPALDLRLSLPSNGTSAPQTPARVTYDLIAEHFGAGYNGPLIVSATIVGSDDPLGLMKNLADDLRALPGVASVPLATPNADASAGIVQVIPEGAPDSTETKDLVRAIRAAAPDLEAKYGVPLAVTGFTAVGIDVSDRLGGALLPFGILVVGLSLVLLAMVFRSVAVPLKATIGFLLSVGAAFGATAAVFEWGWLGSLLNVEQTAPVISFLPILLTGIVFGLAMDYEVFLVSRIREEYVHRAARSGTATQADAAAAIEEGFVASSRVVVAAAIIMFAVFAAFVPEGEGPIKTISFGLAVGVFVDAFLVRMTLVPAVLALLGRSAWWLPGWLDRLLPAFDVEGAGVAHQTALADWPSADDPHVVYAEGLQVGAAGVVAISVLPREVVVVDGPPHSGKTALLLTVGGRMRLSAGRAKVASRVLPEQAAGVRRAVGYLDCGQTPGLRRELAAVLRRKPRVVLIDHADLVTDHDDRAALASLLDDLAVGSREVGVVLGVRDAGLVSDLLPARYSLLTLDRPAELVSTPNA